MKKKKKKWPQHENETTNILFYLAKLSKQRMKQFTGQQSTIAEWNGQIIYLKMSNLFCLLTLRLLISFPPMLSKCKPQTNLTAEYVYFHDWVLQGKGKKAGTDKATTLNTNGSKRYILYDKFVGLQWCFWNYETFWNHETRQF